MRLVRKHAWKLALFLCLGLLAAVVVEWLPLPRPGQTVTVQSASDSVVERASTAIEETEATTLFCGDLEAQKVLAEKAIADIDRGISASDFQTGSERYDGEWAAGSYQMAVLGLGQVILAHPELKGDYLPVMTRGVSALLTPEMNQFGRESWGREGLQSLESDAGHAYLGYTNLALSMLRLHDPNNSFAEVNDALTQSLLRRLEQAPYGIVETYPGEVYPADLAAVIGSIALHDTATSQDHSKVLSPLITHFFQTFVDRESGLVFQSVEAISGLPIDAPRSSGTALSTYFLAFADAEVASTIFQGIEVSQQLKLLDFTGIKEYPLGQAGDGDIDSGTLVSGVSPAATAFSIAGARITHNAALYEALYQTVHFFGTSATTENQSLIDSPLGHAVLLAMLTAQ